MSGDNSGASDLVLVTGASGFVAKHTIRQALAAGYRVRGTVRNDEEAAIAQNAVNKYSPDHKDNFSLVRADLTSDIGWKDAVSDCIYVLHIAAPFPLKPPEGGREALVPISRDGTLRVLRAALDDSPSSVQRIVMVSSIVAVVYWPERPQPVVHLKESDWTDPEWKQLTWAYAIAKTRAELAAWDFAKERQAESKLVAVNPAMIWGPVLDDVECTSAKYCKLFLQGAYPFVPNISYPLVDVRDVAMLLVASLRAANVGGRRLLAGSDTLDFLEISQHMAESFPQFASMLPTRRLPNWIVRLVALCDPVLKNNLPDLETRPEYDCTYVTELTGVTFRSSRDAVWAMANSLIEQNLV